MCRTEVSRNFWKSQAQTRLRQLHSSCAPDLDLMSSPAKAAVKTYLLPQACRQADKNTHKKQQESSCLLPESYIMTTLSSRRTGLRYVLYVRFKAYTQHGPRVKAACKYGDMYSEPAFSITVEDEPRIEDLLRVWDDEVCASDVNWKKIEDRPASCESEQPPKKQSRDFEDPSRMGPATPEQGPFMRLTPHDMAPTARYSMEGSDSIRSVHDVEGYLTANLRQPITPDTDLDARRPLIWNPMMPV
ncbi:hypothetical protein WJX74_001531 [Apatococcus lobatus]|uniref:Uncharacterized protein n=1 Tax=Apatococcus lobatus TaxID=904363 RepID=A0AAW1Q9G0_9CHLO